MRRGNGGIIGPQNLPGLGTSGIFSLSESQESKTSSYTVNFLAVAGGGGGGFGGYPGGGGGWGVD